VYTIESLKGTKNEDIKKTNVFITVATIIPLLTNIRDTNLMLTVKNNPLMRIF